MSKKENRKIQDFDGLYAFLRHYVDFMLRLAYRRIKYIGMEKVPADGAVIYAPNHTNALMDALVILAMDRKQRSSWPGPTSSGIRRSPRSYAS